MLIDLDEFQIFIKAHRTGGKHAIRQRLSIARKLNTHMKGLSADEVENRHVDAFIASIRDKGYAPATLNNYRLVINTYRAFLLHNGHSPNFSKLKYERRSKRLVHVLTPQEIQQLCSEDELQYDGHPRKPVYDALFTFLALTGCRQGEATKLRVRDVNLERREVFFVDTKNGDDRVVPLSNQVITMVSQLTANAEPDDLVFRTRRGKPYTNSSLREVLQRRAKNAGIQKRVFLHLFRHSFVTEMIQQRVPIPIVAAIVGHRKIETTMWYTHLADEAKRQAIAYHPLIRQHAAPRDILRNLRSAIEQFRLTEDERFEQTTVESAGGLNIEIRIVGSQNES